MLFGRIALIGILLAAISAGVIQIRLMNAAAAREIHLLVAREQALQRQIQHQDLELARLRTPQRIVERLAGSGTDLQPPGSRQENNTAKPAVTTPDTARQSVRTQTAAQRRPAGGPTRAWSSHPTHNNRRPARR